MILYGNYSPEFAVQAFNYTIIIILALVNLLCFDVW